MKINPITYPHCSQCHNTKFYRFITAAQTYDSKNDVWNIPPDSIEPGDDNNPTQWYCNDCGKPIDLEL